MKKTRNPFKMWESYVSAVCFPLALIFIYFTQFQPLEFFFGFFEYLYYNILPVEYGLLILPAIFGFLVGWAIGYWRLR